MPPTKEHFATAAEELSSGQVDSGLWAMALSESRGDSALTCAIYLKLRATELSSQQRNNPFGLSARSVRAWIEQATENCIDIIGTSFYFYMAYMALVLVVFFIFMLLGLDGYRVLAIYVDYIIYLGIVSVISAVLYKNYKKYKSSE